MTDAFHAMLYRPPRVLGARVNPLCCAAAVERYADAQWRKTPLRYQCGRRVAETVGGRGFCWQHAAAARAALGETTQAGVTTL